MLSAPVQVTVLGDTHLLTADADSAALLAAAKTAHPAALVAGFGADLAVLREQIAREVHSVSLARGLDELATVIALMTISTEVGAERHGERHWWCPFKPQRSSDSTVLERQ